MPFKSSILLFLILSMGLTYSTIAAADLLYLKSGEELKGLVVEEHRDSLVLSTIDGEVSIKRKDIDEIDYDDPSYTLLNMGRKYERDKKYGLALSYFEKAYNLNPELVEAKKAAVGIRGRFWSDFAEGPLGEIRKQQRVRDAYRASTDLDDKVLQQKKNISSILLDRMGISLIEGDAWVAVKTVKVGSYARKRGLRPGDVLVAIDGKSLRYLNKEVVSRYILEPRFSSMSLDIRRSFVFDSLISRKLKAIGIAMSQAYNGVIISKVYENSPALDVGLKKNDIIMNVAGKPTRYLTLKKIKREIEDKMNNPLSITIKRTLQIPRN